MEVAGVVQCGTGLDAPTGQDQPLGVREAIYRAPAIGQGQEEVHRLALEPAHPAAVAASTHAALYQGSENLRSDVLGLVLVDCAHPGAFDLLSLDVEVAK